MNQHININKLASLEATLVRNSADPLTDSLTGVKCRATSVAKNSTPNNLKLWVNQIKNMN